MMMSRGRGRGEYHRRGRGRRRRRRPQFPVKRGAIIVLWPYRALTKRIPAATHSHFRVVARPKRAACHSHAHGRLPLPSRVPLRRHKTRAPQPADRTRCIPLNCPKSCLPYTSGQSYGLETTTNVQGTSESSAAPSEYWARNSYRSLIVKTTTHPAAQGSLRLVADSRRANVMILLVYCLHLHLSRVLARLRIGSDSRSRTRTYSDSLRVSISGAQ